MKIKFYEDHSWKEIFPENFYNFKYCEDKKLDNKKSWSIFAKDIENIKKFSLEDYIKHGCGDVTKLFHLYHDLGREGMRCPIFFYKGEQLTGHGRGLIASTYYPNMSINAIEHTNETGGIEIIYKILEYVNNIENKPIASIALLEDKGSFYLKQVEYDDITGVVEGHGPNKGTYINKANSLSAKIYFWNFLQNREVDVSNMGSLKKLLDEIINVDPKIF